MSDDRPTTQHARITPDERALLEKFTPLNGGAAGLGCQRLLAELATVEAERDEWRLWCDADGAPEPMTDQQLRDAIEERIEELERGPARIDDAYRMGERLRTLIEKMREDNGPERDATYYTPHTEESIDELAQVATVLLGVKS